MADNALIGEALIGRFLEELGFEQKEFSCYSRSMNRKCPSGSKPVRIEVELLIGKTICFIHIGKHSHRVAVNSCGDLLRIIEVFENEEKT
jgi:hypothetical protein